MVEVRRITEAIMPTGEGMHKDEKNTFRIKYHFTYDNYFSYDLIFNWMGQNGFGLIMNYISYILPKDVTKKYIHKKRTDTINKKKVEMLFERAVELKDVAPDGINEGYRRVHVYFQSTPSCNIYILLMIF